MARDIQRRRSDPGRHRPGQEGGIAVRHRSILARRRYRPAWLWLALLGSLLMVLGLTSTAAYGRDDDRNAVAADQVLNWTAGDPIDRYLTVPETAVAGPATLVFENSEATGNTTSMPHTLTFSVSDPEYNNDVPVNILANPGDSEGGKHSVEVTLTPASTSTTAPSPVTAPCRAFSP
ncbi:hypothetical protein NKH18_44535 [Streptomyces sp. M10(2022)]